MNDSISTKRSGKWKFPEVEELAEKAVEVSCSYCDNQATRVGDGRDGDFYCDDHAGLAPGSTSLLLDLDDDAAAMREIRAGMMQCTPEGLRASADRVEASVEAGECRNDAQVAKSREIIAMSREVADELDAHLALGLAESADAMSKPTEGTCEKCGKATAFAAMPLWESHSIALCAACACDTCTFCGTDDAMCGDCGLGDNHSLKIDAITAERG